MRIGLASFRVENRNILFNISQIERAIKDNAGKVDLLCFGEAVLQGFDSLSWKYEEDKDIAIDRNSEVMKKLKNYSLQYDMGIAFGYIEREGENLYSAYAVIDSGSIVHNFRRISRGWKDFYLTDNHYLEGNDVTEFCFRGRKMMLGLCGDLWDYPERFKTDNLLIWPVYVNFGLDEWKKEMLDYAEHASAIADDAFMINPIDNNPVNHGGAFHFHKGRILENSPFDKESVLIIQC